MANKLLGDWRLRVSDANNRNFTLATRLYFFDAKLMTPKEVYNSIDDEVGLGNIVDLDSSGYVPNTGVWLGTGAYSCRVEEYGYTDEFGEDIYVPLWTIPYIEGADVPSDGTGSTMFETVSQLRAFEPDGDNAIVMGYYTVGDMLTTATFHWDATSTATDDEGSVIKPTSYSITDPGRWIRVFDLKPTIRDFGAIPGQANVKLRILNAQQYATDNNLHLIYPEGTYSLANETLSIPSNSIIEPGFFLDGSGLIQIFGADIRTKVKISDSLQVNDIFKVMPEWWGAIGDGVNDDAIYLAKAAAYANAVGGTVYLSQKYYVSNHDVDINNTLFADGAYIDTFDRGYSLGEIKTEGSHEGILRGDTLYNIPHSGYRVSYYETFDQDLMNSLLVLQSWYGKFIWDKSFTFSASYNDVNDIEHVFENEAYWTIPDPYTVNTKNTYFDINNFDGMPSIANLLGTEGLHIYNQTRQIVDLNYDFSFLTKFFFHNLRFLSDKHVTLSSYYGLYFYDCVFEGTEYNLALNAPDSRIDGCEFKYRTLVLQSYGTIQAIENMSVRNSIFSSLGTSDSGCIALAANHVDVKVLGLNISDNTFTGIVSGATPSSRVRIYSVVADGMNFKNGIGVEVDDAYGVHSMCIKNNFHVSGTDSFVNRNFCPTTEATIYYDSGRSSLFLDWVTDYAEWKYLTLGLSVDGVYPYLFVLAGDTTSKVNVNIPDAKVISYWDAQYFYHGDRNPQVQPAHSTTGIAVTDKFIPIGDLLTLRVRRSEFEDWGQSNSYFTFGQVHLTIDLKIYNQT